MSCCSTSIDEARHERLKALADSINETARMARATLALLLTAALYLGFTLLSSTDENLLLNAQVAVPQVGFGMALEKSYIFGPPIFLYLHFQGLFLLNILYRKIQGFETALDQELPGIPNSQRVRQEYWNLLSAFAFVQLFRQGDCFPFVSRLLAWISIEAVPLLLLFAVALSFVRYQSEWITNIHHAVFVLDLISVISFNYLVFGRRLRSPWILTILFVLAVSTTLLLTMLLLRHARPPSFDIQSIEMDAQEKAKQDETKTARGMFEHIMSKKRNRIWRTDNEELRSIWKAWEAARKKDKNIIDVVLCKKLDIVCRYLNVRDLWLVSTLPADVFASKGDGPSAENFDFVEWSSLNKLSLAGRSLRFADLRFAKLQGVSLEGADLQGANLHRANLQYADLTKAKLNGAYLSAAKLQRAIFEEAELRSVNLRNAALQHASFSRARLRNAHLKEAQLQRTDLTEAKLQGANLESAHMDGASLREAKLIGTNFQRARLRGVSLAHALLLGANLQEAQLQGANLNNAKIQGVALGGTQLEGVDLGQAKIRYSFGKPESWKLAWMYGASIEGDECPEDFTEVLAENLESDEEKMLAESLESDIVLWWDGGEFQKKAGSLKDYMDSIPEMSGYKWLSKKDLPQEEWVIFDAHEENSPSSGCSDVATTHDYWTAWAEWTVGAERTVGFACKNGYTGYKSLLRWKSKDPLSNMKKCICPKNDQEEQCSILDKGKRFILEKLKMTPEDSIECPGYLPAPDSVWWISDSDLRKVWNDDD